MFQVVFKSFVANTHLFTHKLHSFGWAQEQYNLWTSVKHVKRLIVTFNS